MKCNQCGCYDGSVRHNEVLEICNDCKYHGPTDEVLEEAGVTIEEIEDLK